MAFGIVGAGSGTGGPGSTLYGESPETTWSNTVFKAKLMPLTDLADRGPKKIDRVPEDDLLDTFKVGDLVGGIARKDKQAYEGKITRISKTNIGKGYRVFVLVTDGEEEIELLPSSLVFIDETDKNRQDMEQATRDSGDNDVRSRDRGAGKSQYTIPVEEGNKPRKLKHLLEFNEYIKK